MVKESDVDPFASDAARRMPVVPGWSGLGIPDDTVQPGPSTLQAIRAIQLAVADTARHAHQVDLIATTPLGAEACATTRDALKDLLRSAKRELLVLGFAMGHADLEAELRAASARGVGITVIGERSRDDLRHLFQSWPATFAPIRCLHMVEALPDQRMMMHAKVIVADRATTLIGSANFTTGGLSSNIELGLLVSGPVARVICELVEALERGDWFEQL